MKLKRRWRNIAPENKWSVSMPTKPYRLLDHTADLMFEIRGRGLPDLFANACLALFDTLTDLTRVTGDTVRTVTVTGVDRPDLLINWMRELLSLWTVDGLLIKSAKISDLTETRLTAELASDRYAPDRHILKTDIKAVTYHKAAVDRQGNGWTAHVIVDV